MILFYNLKLLYYNMSSLSKTELPELDLKEEYEDEDDDETKFETNSDFDVPDELDIILHTSVPLLGKFYYAPTMSIQTENLITQKDLIFYPLIKLNPNSLKDIPNYEQRVSHFFNRTSYETMVYNYSSSQPLILTKNNIKNKQNSLQYNDNINNNISFILDTIFEPGQTLYLGGKPFTILFYNLKSSKPRITNKISTIKADPNQTIYNTRKKLRKIGKKNKAILEKLQEDTIDDIDDVIDNVNDTLSDTSNKAKGFFDNFKNRIPYFNNNKQPISGGGLNYSQNVETEFQIDFCLDHTSFLKEFSKFISIQINNHNIQSNNHIVYFMKGVWHGIDNVSTTNSIFNLFKSIKKVSLIEIAKILYNIGIKLIINNKPIIIYNSNIILSIYLNHNLETNIIKFIKINSNMTGGRSDRDLYERYMYNKHNKHYNNYNNNYNNHNGRYIPYLSEEDFENTSLNKYEIEVYVELTNKTLPENELKCYIKKKKMLYNTKELFSSEKLFDFTKISNWDLYNPEMDLSKIRPYLDLSYKNETDNK